MASAASLTFSRSAHTLKDLEGLAKQAPEDAAKYLKAVEQKLRAAGETTGADTLREVLTAKTGTLVDRIAQSSQRLTAVFPEQEAGWGELQTQRAGGLMWGTAPETPQQFVTGKLIKQDDGAQLVTAAGRVLDLVQTGYGDGTGTYSKLDVRAFMSEAPITVTGMLGEDNQTFSVEGAAFNPDGRFDTFVEGRVAVDGEKTTIATMRGEVLITDPELAKRLRSLPALQVILPGAADAQGRYTGSPQDFYALANFEAETLKGDGEMRTVLGNMATHHFRGKPIELPAAAVERVKQGGRHYLRGMLELGADGEAAKFKASWVSGNADDPGVDLPGPTPEADPVQAVVMTTEP